MTSDGLALASSNLQCPFLPWCHSSLNPLSPEKISILGHGDDIPKAPEEICLHELCGQPKGVPHPGQPCTHTPTLPPLQEEPEEIDKLSGINFTPLGMINN